MTFFVKLWSKQVNLKIITVFDKQLFKSKTSSPSYFHAFHFSAPFWLLTATAGSPQDDKMILNQAPSSGNWLRLPFQLAKQFCVLVFPKFDFNRLGLISESEVWHFWQYHYNQAWPPQLLPLAVHFVHCLTAREPHHQLENFVACLSTSVWTGVDKKIPFCTLPKTHFWCAGLFSTSAYWKCLASQKLQLVVKLPLTS